ncbi:MAG: tetratricopeptide repeat protein [Kiritimatiellia bacterium]
MKHFGYIFLLVGLLSCRCFCSEADDALAVAREALSDSLYKVARTNAARALGDKIFSRRQEALEILLESLAGQEKFEEILSVLDKNSDIVNKSSDKDTLLYWRVLALFEQERFVDISNIINSGNISTNSFFGIATLRIGARTRELSDDLKGAVELFEKVDALSTNTTVRAANALEWAVSLDKRSKYEEALRVLKNLSQIGVNNDYVNKGALLRGRILMRLGRTEEAARIMDALAMNEHVSEISRVQALVEMSVYKFDSGMTNESVAYARSAYERARLPEARRLAGYRLGDLLCSSPETIKQGAELIKELVREFPESDDSMRAHLKLADSFLQQGLVEEAAEEYRIFLETYPSSALDARVMEGRGWALFRLKRYAEAASAFKKASELNESPSRKVECLFKHCDALMGDERFSAAAEAYGELNARFPDSEFAARALYLSAEALERSGDLDAALERYLKISSRYPRKKEASDSLLRVASIYAARQELDQALDTYSMIVENFTDNDVAARAYMGRGKVYYSKYRFDKAMQDFAAFAEVVPGRIAEARYFQILCLYGLGRDSDALESASTFVVNYPDSRFFPDMLLWLGKFHFNRADYEKAIGYFNDYSTGFADRKWADAALVWKARALFFSGDYTDAIETIGELIKRYPDSLRITEARFIQAESLIEQARFDAAILLLDEIIEIDSESPWAQEALIRKGNCLFALGAGNRVRYEDALSVYGRALQIKGLTPAAVIELYYKTGRCFEKLERYDEAVECYYSDVLIRYQKDKAAGTWYNKKTITLVVRAAFNVAEIYEKKGKYEQAVNVLERIRTVAGGASEEVSRRIKVLKKMGRL